jgi:hypothetical protein
MINNTKFSMNHTCVMSLVLFSYFAPKKITMDESNMQASTLTKLIFSSKNSVHFYIFEIIRFSWSTIVYYDIVIW